MKPTKLNFGLSDADRKLFAKYMRQESHQKTITIRDAEGNQEEQTVEVLVTHTELLRSPMDAYLANWLCSEHDLGRIKIVDDMAYHVTEIDDNTNQEWGI